MGLRVRISTWGFRPQTHTGNSGGQMQPLAAAAMAFFTIRSSSEWKVITASRPPGFSRGMASSMAFATEFSSSFTAMRIAWKLRLAGCCFSRRAAGGMAERITSTSSRVVRMGAVSRLRTIAEAMAGAYRSSPYSYRIFFSSS